MIERMAPGFVRGSAEVHFYIQKSKRGKNIQAIRGMNDYLHGETAIWQRIEGTLKNVNRQLRLQ